MQSLVTGQAPITLLHYDVVSLLCRGFVTTELVFLLRGIGTDVGCAGCRQVEIFVNVKFKSGG